MQISVLERMNFGGWLCKFIRSDLSRLWHRGGPVPSKNMQTPTLPSIVSISTWKIPSVLNRMKNLILALSQLRICRAPPPQKWWKLYEKCGMCWIEWEKKFSNFGFSSYCKISTKIGVMTLQNDHNLKSKNRRIFNLVFLFSQPIADLSCKFEK